MLIRFYTKNLFFYCIFGRSSGIISADSKKRPYTGLDPSGGHTRLGTGIYQYTYI